MRLVVQRVTSASVTVEGEQVGAIGLGLLVLVGFGREDEAEPTPSPMLARMARKLVQVRIFPGDTGKLDRDVADVGGHLLAVSQFTLHADCRPIAGRADAPRSIRPRIPTGPKCCSPPLSASWSHCCPPGSPRVASDGKWTWPCATGAP